MKMKGVFMPDCHECNLNGHPTERCFKCPGPSENPNNHGRRFVSVEHLSLKEVAKLKVPETDPENHFAEFMRKWLYLPPKARDLLSLAITDRSQTCAALARKAGVSRQYVHKLLLNIARSFPEMETILRLRVRALSPKTSALLIKKGINNG